MGKDDIRQLSLHCARLVVTGQPYESVLAHGVADILRTDAGTGVTTWHGIHADPIAAVEVAVSGMPAIEKDHGAQIGGARALLVGAGGAGSAIAIALLDAGVRELVIHDADQSRVATLLGLLAATGERRATAGPGDPTGFDLVLNASPMGMNDDDPLPVDGALLTSSMFVGDVIAGHDVTPLLAAAQVAGCKTANGGHMVQAVQDLMADFMNGK